MEENSENSYPITLNANNKRPRNEAEDHPVHGSKLYSISENSDGLLEPWGEDKLRNEWKSCKLQTETMLNQFAMNMELLEERERNISQREQYLASREKLLEEKERLIREEEEKARLERNELARRSQILRGIETQSKEERAEVHHMLWLSQH